MPNLLYENMNNFTDEVNKESNNDSELSSKNENVSVKNKLIPSEINSEITNDYFI